MQLTLQTDYALRVLLYLAIRQDKRVTTAEIAQAYGISRNHLVKVVNNLAHMGYIDAIPGRIGGLALSRSPQELNIGEIVARIEPGFALVACLPGGAGGCPIAPVCALKGAIEQALASFLAALRVYRLSDLLDQRGSLLALLGIEDGG
jgi:Rrf2 family nitric oxide-sensitive transcriptional repressor